jgi:hypothetical protein
MIPGKPEMPAEEVPETLMQKVGRAVKGFFGLGS